MARVVEQEGRLLIWHAKLQAILLLLRAYRVSNPAAAPPHFTWAGISLAMPTFPVVLFSSMRSVAGPATAPAGTRTESS